VAENFVDYIRIARRAFSDIRPTSYNAPDDMIRRVIAYALIAIGVLCAALLSLAINMASSDLHEWLSRQPWYDSKLLWITAGLLVGVGVILAILQAPSAASKKTPTALTVEAGIVDPRRYLNPPEGAMTAHETSVLYLLDTPKLPLLSYSASSASPTPVNKA
jgi:hypothetical protein